MVDKVQVKGRLQLYRDVSAGPLLGMKVHSDRPQHSSLFGDHFHWRESSALRTEHLFHSRAFFH